MLLQMLDVKAMSRRLNLDPEKLKRLLKAGHLPPATCHVGRTPLWSEDAVASFLKLKQQPEGPTNRRLQQYLSDLDNLLKPLAAALATRPPRAKAQQDAAHVFILQMIEPEEQRLTPAAALMEAQNLWAECNAQAAANAVNFGRAMTKLLYRRDKEGGRIVYHARLKTNGARAEAPATAGRQDGGQS